MPPFLLGLLLLLIFTVFAALIAAVIATAVQQHRKMVELREFGVETTAIIERSEPTDSRNIGGLVSVVSQPTDRRTDITYRYTDRAGTTHTGVYRVTAAEAHGLPDAGAPLSIVYSSKTPSVSAPKHLLDRYRP